MIVLWRRWEPIACEQIIDVSFGRPGIPVTYVLYRRKRDGKTVTVRVDGHWTLARFTTDSSDKVGASQSAPAPLTRPGADTRSDPDVR